MAEETVQEAQATGPVLSECYTLALTACPIALWSGNLTAAARHTKMLLDLSKKYGLLHLATDGLRYQRAIALKGGDVDTELPPRESGVDEITQPSRNFRWCGLSEMAEALAHAGRSGEGRAPLDGQIDRSEINWLTAQ